MVQKYLTFRGVSITRFQSYISIKKNVSGVARGSGWQHIGAYVNLGAFYVIGVPVGIVLGFISHFRSKGLWVGIVVGSIFQTLFLFIITALTNWKKQVHISYTSYFTIIKFISSFLCYICIRNMLK